MLQNMLQKSGDGGGMTDGIAGNERNILTFNETAFIKFLEGFHKACIRLS